MDRAGRIFVVLTVALTVLLLWLGGGPPGAAFAAPAVNLSADTVGRCEKLELTVTGWHPESFGDVPWDHWALEQIEACVAAGLVSGYPDGLYRPALPVDRAQMAVYVARALAGGNTAVPPGPAEPTFPDVPLSYWAYRHIEYVAANAIVEGYADGSYRPDGTVDRAQMAVFIARATATPTGEAGLADYVPPETPTFADVTPGGAWAWCHRHVEYVAAAGVVRGYPDGLYRPARTCSRDQMAVYVQRAFGVPLLYDNPFDPSQLDLVGEFETPTGGTVTVPGFYFAPYGRSLDPDGEEVLSPSGPPELKVRFAAQGETGTYEYRLLLTDWQGTGEIGQGSFEVTASDSMGYVRRSPTAPLRFEFDSGDPYFAIGENMCWPGGGGTYDYDDWLGELAASGGNYIRLWLINEWNKLGLEHLPASPRDGNGLGRYDQRAAWRIDHILDLALSLDCRVLMCIESFNSLDAYGIYGQWQRYPYGAVWGGPCEEPMDFFTDEEAKRLFEQRLRYLVARWGYSTAVLAWELWNEVDLVTGYESATVASWHEEMADYLRSIDPWQHLITTSYANTDGDAAVDGLGEMDFVQSHNYGSHDVAGIVHSKTAEKVAAYGKPHYFGEFGTDWRGEGNASDPAGLHLHNGLWASALSQSAGTAMIWWWDSYVHPLDLYHHFASLAAFVDPVDWTEESYQPCPVVDLRYAPGHEPTSYPAITVDPPGESWEDGSPYNEAREYVVGNDGTVTDHDLLSRVQHGLVNHPTWHNPATFHVDYPAAGTFEVLVNGVSGYGGAGLVVSLDGVTALEVDFPDARPDDYETMHQYDGTYAIDVPTGPHTVIVENRGTDWFYVSYRLTDYLTVPNLRVLALSNATSALVWIQNRESTWWNQAEGIVPMPVGESEVELAGSDPGSYRIEQWNTYTGTISHAATHVSTDGSVVITTPSGLTSDVAYKLIRAGP